MIKEVRTLVIQPPISDEMMWGRFKKGSGYVPPLGIMYIASFMESKGFHADILDCLVERYKISDLKEYLSKNKYDLIGITCMTNSALDAYESVKVAREVCPSALIVMGGVHPTALPEQTLKETPETDLIIIGEGEQTFVDLATCLKEDKDYHSISGIAYWSKEENKVKYTTPRTPIPDLNSLPFPAYDKVPMKKYIPHVTQYIDLPNYPVVLQRGCPYQCTYCDHGAVLGRKIRSLSVERAIENIKYLVKNYGAKGIYFLDSVFTVRRDYIMKLLPEIEKLKISFACNARADQLDLELLTAMKKAGCWMIQIGIESGNIKSLELIKKASYSSAFKPDPNDPNGRPYLLNKYEQEIRNCQKLGIQVMASYILGLPGETVEDVETTIRFAKRLATETALFFLPVPYPGSHLLTQAKEDGGLKENMSWKDYSAVDYSNPVYINPRIGKEKMQELLKRAFDEYYKQPIVIYRNLKAIKSLKDIAKYVKAFRALSGV
ncbi:MAG: cobalamin B12-binding domain-containing protein [Candidatus Melainabacteria bacterium]|nr:cobalamin B12-binding domain-containing protein [Candidatus Melainabacteria bacterium]